MTAATGGQLTIDGRVVKTCAVRECGRGFVAMRSDARYCSGACRMVAKRQRDGGRARPRTWSSEVRPAG